MNLNALFKFNFSNGTFFNDDLKSIDSPDMNAYGVDLQVESFKVICVLVYQGLKRVLLSLSALPCMEILESKIIPCKFAIRSWLDSIG